MTKILCLSALFIVCSVFVFGQNNSGFRDSQIDDQGKIPFSTLFYEFGKNSVNSFTYNYGANYLVAGLSTYYFAHSGIDWEWSKIAHENKALVISGRPFGALGFVLPAAIPLGLYLYGRRAGKTDLQITGLALGQAALQGVLISSSIKAFTGRRNPEITNGHRPAEDFSEDFAWGFMERGVFSGWPSSHTAVVFAMAVTLAELYPESTGFKIASYSYAILTGIGMSFIAHWASDVVAGALIGYSIGKSVGISYKTLFDRYSGSGGTVAPRANMNNTGFNLADNLSFIILPNYMGINICY